MLHDYLTASEAARRLSETLSREVSPREVSNVLYNRKVDTGSCPILGGRRLIPQSLLAEIARVLRQAERAEGVACGN
jgi:hypothetical protein